MMCGCSAASAAACRSHSSAGTAATKLGLRLLWLCLTNGCKQLAWRGRSLPAGWPRGPRWCPRWPAAPPARAPPAEWHGLGSLLASRRPARSACMDVFPLPSTLCHQGCADCVYVCQRAFHCSLREPVHRRRCSRATKNPMPLRSLELTCQACHSDWCPRLVWSLLCWLHCRS